MLLIFKLFFYLFIYFDNRFVERNHLKIESNFVNRKHYYIISEQNNWKFDYLIDLIDSLVKRFVIFTNSKTNAIKIYKKLKKNNINVDKNVFIFLFLFLFIN